MRCNNKELCHLAHLPEHNFDKEGILFLKEKQEGLFKKGEGSYSIIFTCLSWINVGSLLQYCLSLMLLNTISQKQSTGLIIHIF